MYADDFKLFIDFFIDELNDAVIGLNEDLHLLWNIARNTRKSYVSRVWSLKNVISAWISIYTEKLLRESLVFPNSITAPLCIVFAWIRALLVDFNLYRTTL